jgi:RNA polymerase sigma factor (sigma-70 family)
VLANPVVQHPNDEAILNGIRNGNPDGLSLIYKQYRENFISWCSKTYSCSSEESKDIYQNAVVILYENTVSGKFNGTQASVKTYLFAIGKNKARETFRKNNRMVSYDYNEDDTFANDEPSGFPEEDIQVVQQSLNELGDPCKQLLERHYFQRETMEEIAKRMGYKNSDTAKNQKYKCLLRLRAIFYERRVKVNNA